MIVSGVVNQVFLWLRASFTLAGFHCSRRLASRPGNQQVHRQVRRAEDKAYWLTAAAPRSSKLAVWTVMLWGRLGTAQSASFTQTKKNSLLWFVVVVVFQIYWHWVVCFCESVTVVCDIMNRWQCSKLRWKAERTKHKHEKWYGICHWLKSNLIFYETELKTCCGNKIFKLRTVFCWPTSHVIYL